MSSVKLHSLDVECGSGVLLSLNDGYRAFVAIDEVFDCLLGRLAAFAADGFRVSREPDSFTAVGPRSETGFDDLASV